MTTTTDTVPLQGTPCPRCQDPLDALTDDHPSIETPSVCRAPGTRRLTCPNPRCDYALHLGTTLKAGDQERTHHILDVLAHDTALNNARLEQLPRGPAIPAALMHHIDLQPFRTLSLNAGDDRTITRRLARLFDAHVPDDLDLGIHSAGARFIRPNQDIDLWCMPQLTPHRQPGSHRPFPAGRDTERGNPRLHPAVPTGRHDFDIPRIDNFETVFVTV